MPLKTEQLHLSGFEDRVGPLLDGYDDRKQDSQSRQEIGLSKNNQYDSRSETAEMGR